MSTKLEEITVEEFKEILDSYFAKPEKRSNMTLEEAIAIAKVVNKKINIPLVNETNEEKIIVKFVLSVDNFLYDNLPNELYDLCRSFDDGIDDAEASRLISVLVNIAKEKLKIPYIPHPFDKLAIRIVISIVVNAARKGFNLIFATSTINLDNPGVISKKVALT